MNQELKSAWLRMEQSKENFLKLLEGWSSDQLSRAPEDGWNALQVVEHLVMSEHGTLSYVQRKMQAPPQELEIAGEVEAGTSRNLNLALKSDERWQAPPVLAPPSGDHSIDSLLTSWSDIRKNWEKLLNEIDDDYLDKKLFRHPLAGRLTLTQTLSFVEHHVIHHVHQIRRIATAIG